ncbi:hypothetical protein D9619_002019 [Psilocybe cf. subviscida]|uniref:DNA ligase n=1 Tax=Psilocybe cf. subviscida TaxID=2480587 RepID=A0A8H5F499_9AGAR|nr:hypothetical protein D9619_002019 [Psilocybe cf. subviscida]
MPKRTAESSSPTKNKRTKLQADQRQLDAFFSSPKAVKSLPASVPAAQPAFVQGSSKHLSTPGKPAVTPLQKTEIIDVDELESDDNADTAGAAFAPAPVTPSPKKPRAVREESSKPSPVRSPAKRKEPTVHIDPDQFAALDVDPNTYDPTKQPTTSSAAPYSLLTHALVALSQTRSRIAIINILTNLLRTIIAQHPSSLLPAVYLLSNSLAPQFVALELGLGSSILTRSIRQISGLSAPALKKLYNTTGDPGDVAFAAKSNIRTLIPHPSLTIPGVYDSLRKIAKCSGQGAAKEKQKIVEKLLLSARGEEVRYLTRTLCQNLRVGAVRTSILTALARAVVLTPPSSSGEQTDTSTQALSKEDQMAVFKNAESLLKQVYVKHPAYDDIIPAVLDQGLISLAERVPLSVGIPLLPMLGSPTRSLDEIYHRLGDSPFSAEFKYDGQRAQIHAFRNAKQVVEVSLFSRHLENMTSKYPDVVNFVKLQFESSETLQSFIIDAEVVAVDPTTGALKSFQDLSGRARKDVNIKDVQVAVCIYAFDLMYLNSESLLNRTFRERRALLRTTFQPRKAPQDDRTMSMFDFVEDCESSDRSVIEEFMLKAVENRCEGLMIKLLDDVKVETEETTEKKTRLKSLPSTYEPDVRTQGWLKLKKDYIDSMGDSIDVIPVGAWHGNGRKAKWWSPVLFALWNPDTGRPVALCKCMSGFTDAFYISLRETYTPGSDNCSTKPLWECDFGGFRPDVYFKPREVWEMRGADITESPVSPAALGLTSSSRGLSIRFPRFIRTREDKGIEQASTPVFLVDIWRSQQGKPKASRGGNDEGDLINVVEGDSDGEIGEEEEDSSEGMDFEDD